MVAYGFKQFVLFSLVVVLLGATLVYGLKVGLPSESETEEPITVERIFDEWGLKLAISVEKRTYAYGEPINITLALKNIVNETVIVVYPYIGPRFSFSVFNTSDVFNKSKPEPVAIWKEPPPLTAALFSEVILTVGESFTSTLQWKQQQLPIHGEERASPGTYYVFGYMIFVAHVERGSFRSEEPVGAVLLYEPIEITVLPP
jgi:hypothetical protein